jgi:hypothetical protein
MESRVILTFLNFNPGEEPQYPLDRRLVDSTSRTGRFGRRGKSVSPTGIRILDTQVLIPTNVLNEASKFCRLLFSKKFHTSYILITFNHAPIFLLYAPQNDVWINYGRPIRL